MRGTPIAEVIEEVEFLRGTDTPGNIATRLGYSSPKNLAKVLHRAGRHDLASPFEKATAMTSITVTSLPEPPQSGRLDKIIHDAEASEKARTRHLAAKVRKMLDDLSARLEAETEDAKRAEKIAALEAEIRRLKAGGSCKNGGGAVRGDFPCDECDRHFDSKQGVVMHRRRAHEGFDPNAVAS